MTGVLDGISYEAQLDLLLKYEMPFSVQFDIGKHDWLNVDRPRLIIKSACGAVLTVGPFPSLGAAGVVREHFEERVICALDTFSAAEFVDNFHAEQAATGNEWGLWKGPAPDWYNSYTIERFG